MKRKIGMKYWVIFFMLLSLVMGIITLGYRYKLSAIRYEANENFKWGVQLMTQGIEKLDESGDLTYRMWISEGYGLISASFDNSKYRKNKDLLESIIYLNNMMTNRSNISEIIEQNDFSSIRKDLKRIWKCGEEESFARSFYVNIRENTETK